MELAKLLGESKAEKLLPELGIDVMCAPDRHLGAVTIQKEVKYLVQVSTRYGVMEDFYSMYHVAVQALLHELGWKHFDKEHSYIGDNVRMYPVLKCIGYTAHNGTFIVLESK